MKVLIPAAGRGTRLRPHTYHRPKPLIPVAGKTVLGHVLDKLAVLDIDELIFVVGHLGRQIESYVAANYDYRTRYVLQEELLGQAHAVGLAREWLDGPLVILFVDTIFEADLSALSTSTADGVIYYKEVEDPRRFGIVTVGPDGWITQFEEKPESAASNKAVIGLYYVKEGQRLVAAIDNLIQRHIQTGGEYYLADALQILVDEGAKLEALPATIWEDCGTVPAVLQTNQFLLERMSSESPRLDPERRAVVVPPVWIDPEADIRDSVVGPYVHVAAGCRIYRSVIGPYVSLAQGASVTGSLVLDAIVDAGASVEDAALTRSLIGEAARVRGSFERLNVGDSSEIDAGPSNENAGLAPPRPFAGASDSPQVEGEVHPDATDTSRRGPGDGHRGNGNRARGRRVPPRRHD